MENTSIFVQSLVRKYYTMLVDELGGEQALTPIRQKTVEHTAHLLARADELVARDLDKSSTFYAVGSLHRQIERQYKLLGLVDYGRPLRDATPANGENGRGAKAPATVHEYARAQGNGSRKGARK